MKRVRSLVSALIAACVLVAQPAQSDAREVVDRVIAVVNESIVTESDLIRFMPIYVQVMGVDPRRLETASARSELASELAEYLIVTALMIDDARAREQHALQAAAGCAGAQQAADFAAE